MSCKRPMDEDPPPASSTSVEEEDEDEDEEEEVSSPEDGDELKNGAEEDQVDDDDEDDGDDEEEKTPLKLNKRKADSDEGGSDSDNSLPSPNVSDFTIKPISTKPQKSAAESSSKRKKAPSSASNGAAAAAANVKAPPSAAAAANVKTPGGSRLWSEADEIAILKSMIEYSKSKKGADPSTDPSGFHEFTKQSIQAEVNQNQLKEKIRRLKKKYMTNAEKGQNGNDPIFSKPHDQKSYDLSKKIWGSNGNQTNDKGYKKTKKKLKTPNSDDQATIDGLNLEEGGNQVKTLLNYGIKEENVDFWKDFPCLESALRRQTYGDVGEFLIKGTEEMAGLVGRERLNRMELILKKLRVKETELYAKRVELLQEQAKAALDDFKGH